MNGHISRRTFMRGAAGGALAGASLPLLLAACGGAASSASSGTTASVGSSSSTKVANLYPTYAPVQGGPKPDFPSSGPEYEDGFSFYPKNATKLWTKDPPGSGGVVNAFTIRLSGLPATPVDQNLAWQAVNKQLNADVRFNNPLSADYNAKLAAVMAGNDLPDIILFNGGLTNITSISGVSNLGAFLEQSMADLTPYLAGDAAKDYPFMAAIPTFAWKNSGCAYNGKLYMWPLERYLPGNAWMRNVDIWDKEIGPGYVPKNADDFKRILVQLTSPKDTRYAIGGTTGIVSGGGINVTSLLRIFPSMFGAPNNWKADASGNLVKDYETPEYKEAVGYFRDLVTAGVFFPDTLTAPTGPTQQSFPTGKSVLTLASFGVTWTSMWNALQAIKPPVKFLPLPPFPGHDGAKPVHYPGPGFLVTLGLKKAAPNRLKELLGIADWLAAPFGSAEDLLLTYGLSPADYTLDADGHPVATAKTSADVDAVGWKYINQRPQVASFPGWPDFAKMATDFEKVAIPAGVPDASVGLISQTQSSKGITLAQAWIDGMTDILLGRRQLSEYDGLLKAWQTGGGNQIRMELQKAMASA